MLHARTTQHGRALLALAAVAGGIVVSGLVVHIQRNPLALTSIAPTAVSKPAPAAGAAAVTEASVATEASPVVVLPTVTIEVAVPATERPTRVAIKPRRMRPPAVPPLEQGAAPESGCIPGWQGLESGPNGARVFVACPKQRS